MSIGSILKEARERKGLTIAEVAERTRMIHQLVEEIECDDFHRIAAAIYGRGFIKLFSECVNVDPAPLLEEFNEVYKGFRKPGQKGQQPAAPKAQPEPSAKPAKPAATAPKAAPAAPSSPPAKTAPVTPDQPADQAPKTVDAAPATPASPSTPVTPAAPVAPASPVAPVPTTPQDQSPEKTAAKVPEPATSSEPTPPPKTAVSLSAETDQSALAGLGELFDAEARRRAASNSASEKPRGESHINIPVIHEAPSWDDAPISDDDPFRRLLSHINVKAVALALAGVFAAALIIFALVLASRPGGSEPGLSESAGDGKTGDAESAYTTPFAPPPDTYVK